MKNPILITKSLAFLLIVSAFLQSCIFINGESSISPRGLGEQEFKLKDFEGLDIGNAFNIHVSQGPFKIIAKGDLADLDDLDAYINRSGDLVVRYRTTINIQRRRVDIDITMPSFKAGSFSGATRTTIEKFNNFKNIDLILSGASSLTFTGTTENLRMNASGASDVTLNGSSAALTVNLSGASRLESPNFTIDAADLDLSGASFARVYSRKTLRVAASGASTVRYKGTPDIRQTLSGGSVVRAD